MMIDERHLDPSAIAIALGLCHTYKRPDFGASVLSFTSPFAHVGKIEPIRLSDDKAEIAPVHGSDGKHLQRIIRQSQQFGVSEFNRIVADAMRRYVPGKDFLTHADQLALSNAMASVNSTANLFGRAKIRSTQQRLEQSHSGTMRFSESDPVINPDKLTPVIRSPMEAVEYFMGLFPTMGIDPERFINEQRRHAFTLAASSNRILTMKVQDAIAKGLKENQSTSDVTHAIQQRLDEYGATPKNAQYAQMVFRTNAADAYTTGIYEEGRSPDMQEFFPAWEYVGILDNRTGDDHRPHIGKLYPSHATFADVRGKRPYNCLLPDSNVSGSFVGASKVWYSGESIHINTRKGARLSVTPNHPVLTTKGFVAAGELHKGMDAVNYANVGRNVDGLNKNNQDHVSSVENTFKSLSVIFGGSRKSKVSFLDFYSDGRNCHGNIDIVSADIELAKNIQSAFRQSNRQFSFSKMLMRSQLKPSFCAKILDSLGIFAGTSRILRVNRLVDSLFLSHTRPFEPLRVGSAANIDIPRRQNVSENMSTDADLIGKLLERFPGLITSDEIVNIERREFSGHVYDLETEIGYFAANSLYRNGKKFATSVAHNSMIIIANCRCNLRWIDHYDLADMEKEGKKVETEWGDDH